MNEFKNVDFWVHQQWKIAEIEIHWSYKGVEVKKKKNKATNTNGYLFTIEIKNTTKERDLCLYKNSTKNFLISW